MNPKFPRASGREISDKKPTPVPAGAKVEMVDGRRVVTFPVHLEVVVDPLDASNDEEAVICVAERLSELGLFVHLGGVPLAHVIEKIP